MSKASLAFTGGSTAFCLASSLRPCPGLNGRGDSHEKRDQPKVSLAPSYAARSIAPAPLAKSHRATMLAAKWFAPQADAFDGSPLASVSRLRAAGPIF
jgi:hypothetical protein